MRGVGEIKERNNVACGSSLGPSRWRAPRFFALPPPKRRTTAEARHAPPSSSTQRICHTYMFTEYSIPTPW